MSNKIKNIIKNISNEASASAVPPGGECEVSTCNCTSVLFGAPYYQDNFPISGQLWEENCWNDYGNVMGNGQTNNCTKVACKPGQGCVNIPYSDPDWATTPFVGCNAMNDCNTQYPNGCDPVGPEICCDVWVCVGSGTNSECCVSLELCKPQGAPMDTNYPNGFPWHLVESSNIPPKEFNRILKENLILEWTCNMDWSAHFGIWLGTTKQECLDGPSWSGVGPASGQGPCGPCAVTPTITKNFDAEFAATDAENMIDKWKKEGRVRRLDESFYNNIISLVEDVYHTQKLLKS